MRYRVLGSSGLRVSEVALGTATFGTTWGWGADRAACAQLFDQFADAGGNLFDCSDIYQEGESELILGELLAKDRGNFLVATKFTASTPGPIARSGNNRKHMFAAVDESLRRLKTDYIDIFIAHFWDGVTFAEELAESFHLLVEMGKVRYFGVSNFPAWYSSRLATLCADRSLGSLTVLQLEYNLVERSAEWEQLPMAVALDIGVLTYSPLATGILSGVDRSASGGRARSLTPVDERVMAIQHELTDKANLLGCSPSQLAIAWVRSKSAPMVVPILGASHRRQLASNLKALELAVPDDVLADLDRVSTPPTVFPSPVLLDAMRLQSAAGNAELVDSHRPWRGYW